MEPTHLETEHKIEEYTKEKRKRDIVVATLSATVIALCAILGFSVVTFNDLLDNRTDRIGVLETTVDDQRNQFIECVDAEPGTEGCTNPVAPKAEDIPGSDGKDGARGPKGEKGEKGDPGLMGLMGMTGKDGRNGFNGVDGSDGSNGSNGVDGVDGAPGAPGLPGANAPAIIDIYCSNTTGVFTFDNGNSINVSNMCYGEPVIITPPEDPTPDPAPELAP